MANLLKVDMCDLDKMTAFLRKNSRSGGAIAIAVQQTLNGMAFLGRKRAIKYTIPKVMTVRNKSYVSKSIRVNKVPYGLPISSMEAQLGAADKLFGKKIYGWAEMEKGSSVRTPYRGKHGLHATKFARKGTYVSQVSKSRRIKSLSMTTPAKLGAKASNPKKAAIQALLILKNKKSKQAVTIEYKSGKKGIFQIIGGQAKMLYRIGARRYSLKRRRWLMPAADYAARRGDKIYAKEANKQIERLSKKLGIKYV